MTIAKDAIQLLFSAGLFLNALLFIPQAIQIIREKSAKGVSLLTFLGFLLIQFSIVLHGFVVKDYLLVVGYIVSMVTCGTVIVLVLRYRQKPSIDHDLSSSDILNQLPCNVYWKNKQGVFLGCNESNLKNFKFKSLEDHIGKTDYDILSNSEADQVRAVDATVIKTGEPQTVEEEMISANGRTVYLSHKIPLRNKKNIVIGVLGVSVDVTERNKETAEKLRTLENVISIMPGNVYWLNRDGVYLGCNDHQAKLIGLASRKEIVGKRNVEIPGFLIPEVLDKYNQQVMEGGESIVIEEPAVLPDGSDAVYLSTKTPLRNSEDEVVGIVGISIDITDRKQMENELITAKEKAEVANKAKKEFLYNMRHDIRTPFSGITGMATLLKTQETDEKKLQYINNIYTSSEELLDYLNTILELTQIERGAIPVVSSLVDVKLLIQSCFNMFSSSIADKQIDFTFNCDEATSFKCNTDEFRIKRIVINLLGNAIKFTGSSGSITIDLCLLNTKASTPQKIQISVRDTGIGIPIEKQNIIFEKFERLTSSYRGDYKGTGLGLYAVKTLINELGGDVKVISESGKGSTFTCDIPVKKATTRDDEGMLLDAKNKDRPTFKNTTSSPSLLLVEDVEVIQLATATLLENLNCFVDVAGTGRQAIELCRTNNYDLILMDIGLPDIDGYVTTQEIRQLKNYENINIVALTAHAEAEVSQECRLAGMNSVITKPLTQAKAIDLLNTYIVSNPSLKE